MKCFAKTPLLCCLMGVASVPASASEAIAGKDELWRWNWAPYIIWPLVLCAGLYALGLIRMWVRQHRIGASLPRTVCFGAGWLSLLLALDSPLHEWSEQLFWVHMTQHEILVLVSAPLLVIGRPGLVWLWALPQSWRNAAAAVLKHKAVEFSLACISAPLAAW